MTNKLTMLCQINGGCMGCCGHDFISPDKIREAIRLNTLEFNNLKPKTIEQFIKFRDRSFSSDLRYGVCRNLIKHEDQIFCPLHPTLHKEELREGHCDIHHFCKTAKEFESWDNEKKEKFIDFVASKKLDNIEFSMKMDDNSLLKEFNSQ
jgi:hypothetical protein